MAATRPFRSEYRDSRNRVFKVGRASTLPRAIVAATRTLMELGLRRAVVCIHNQHGIMKSVVSVSRNALKIDKWR